MIYPPFPSSDPVSAAAWGGLLQNQMGGGIDPFVGYPYQRGAGFGSLLRSVVRLVTPGVKALGKEALRTGVSVAKDALQGEDGLESLEKHGKASALRMLDSMDKKSNKSRPKKKKRRKVMKGGAKGGRKRHRKKKAVGGRRRRKKKVVGGRRRKSKKKRTKKDIFDSF